VGLHRRRRAMPSAGFGGDRFIIPQGLAHALFTGVGYEYSFFQSKKNCQTARKEEKK
jgi:hypothetical protein